MATAAEKRSIFEGVKSDMVRLRLVGGVWRGVGAVDGDMLASASDIAAASPYRVGLSDSSDPMLAGRAGWCNHRTREIRVALRGFWHSTLAHEVMHSCQPMLSDDDAEHLATTVARMFPTLTVWQRHQGWTTDPGEREACLYASWRCRSLDGFRPDDERTLSIFESVARGKFGTAVAPDETSAADHHSGHGPMR